MRTFIYLSLAVVLLGGLIAAQPHTNGWFVPGAKMIHYVAPNGAVTSAAFGTSNNNIAIMSWDNRYALVPDFGKNAILKIDPGTLTVAGTFMIHPRFVQARSCMDFVFDSNGDMFFTANQPMNGIFRVPHGSSNFTTVFSNTNNTTPLYWINQMTVDVDTGDLIVGDDNHLNPDRLYLMRRDGTQYSTIGTMGGPYAFRNGSYKHIPTGDIYSGTASGTTTSLGQSILALKAGTSQGTVFLNHPVLKQAQAPWPDRASAATQLLITPSKAFTTPAGANGLWRVDIGTQAATKIATITTDAYKAVPAMGRNVQTIRTATGKWDARVSFPMYGNRVFTLVFGMSGVRPGVPLRDGRNIPMVLDDLSFLSATGRLAPFITNNVGVLNRTGLGVAKVDVSGIGKALDGMRVWLCAVVFDPYAPLGIGVISDPKCLVLEGM